MVYCVKKIQDLDQQQDQGKNQGLSLRRSNSTVDEDKMAGILVKTLQLLVGELEISRKRLDKAEPMDAKKLDYLYRYQNLINESADSLAGYLTQRKGFDIPTGRRQQSKFEVNFFAENQTSKFNPKKALAVSELFDFSDNLLYAKNYQQKATQKSPAEEEKIEKIAYIETKDVESSLRPDLEKLDSAPAIEDYADSSNPSGKDRVLEIIKPIQEMFANFSLEENSAPEGSDEPLTSENKYKFNITYAWKHIQKIEKILNILYRAVTQLPETTIACLFSSSFSGKLNQNFEIVLNIITGYYPFSNQTVAINILKQLILHSSIIRENSYTAIAKSLVQSLTTDEKSSEMRSNIHHKNRMGLVYDLCRHGTVLSNKIIELLREEGAYGLITKILTFGCVVQSVRRLPGSVVSVRSTSSTDGILACKSLLLLDRNNLDLYVPPSITQSCKKQPFVFSNELTPFNDGIAAVYHHIPALDLLSGEIVLIKESEILPSDVSDELTQAEAENIYDRIITSGVVDFLSESSSESLELKSVFVRYAERMKDSRLAE